MSKQTNLEYVVIDERKAKKLEDELNAHAIAGFWVEKYLCPTRLVMARYREEE